MIDVTSAEFILPKDEESSPTLGYVKLTKEQVATHWDLVSSSLEKSMPPEIARDDEKMNNILKSLLSGALECYAIVGRTSTKVITYGFVTLTIASDQCSGGSCVLIYSITSLRMFPLEFWEDGLKALREYAKSRRCNKIIAYSRTARIIEMAEAVGARTDYRVIELEV